MNEPPVYNPFDNEEKNAQLQGDNTPIQSGYSNLNPIEQGSDSGRILRLVLLISGLMGCCILAIVGFAYFQPSTPPFISQLFPSPTATITPTPSLTFTPTSTPTPSVTPTPTLNLTNTAQVFESTATNVANQWKVLLTEGFDNNRHAWYVGSPDDDYAKIDFKVAEGKYQWTATAHQGFIQWIPLNQTVLTDFFLSAEAQETGDPAIGDYGLTFREDKKSNLYYFGISSNAGQFYVGLNFDNEWTELIGWTESSAILSDEPNRLAVLGQGSHFVFFINHQYVAETTDDHLPKGTTALAVELYKADDQSSFEFDNVQLSVPPK